MSKRPRTDLSVGVHRQCPDPLSAPPSHPGLLSPMKRELLLRLQTDIERVTDAWMSTALKSLLLIQSRCVWDDGGGAEAGPCWHGHAHDGVPMPSRFSPGVAA